MLIKNASYIPPKFKLYPVIAEEKDSQGALSTISPKVLLIHDVRSFYHYSIQELGNFELDQAYNALCENEVLKLEQKHLEVKSLTHIIHMPRKFWIKWIRFVLSQVHDMTF